MDHGKSVHPHLVSGWWKDTGKIEDMLEANRIILDTFTARGPRDASAPTRRVEGKVVVEKGARLERAHGARAPPIIGAGAEIRDAFVGPYTADRARTASSTAARSRTRSSSRARGSSGSRCGSRTR